MKSTLLGPVPTLSAALLACSLMAGCGGGGSGGGPRATATPLPNSTPVPGTTPTATPSATPDAASARLNTIVFVSGRDGNNEIYSARADGSLPTRLTTSPADDNSPSRSRDGNRVVFSSLRAGNPEIYTMPITGEATGLLRLTADAGTSAPDDTSPVFSADGSRIAWISTRGGSANVWIMDATGTNQRQLTNEGNIASPAFSPDGTEIAFSVSRPVSGTTGGASSAIIVARNIATGTERTVVQGAFDALSPRYSPNGNQLVFTARSGTTLDLRLVTLSTGAISSGPSTGFGSGQGNMGLKASFSPDGNRLVFDTPTAQGPQIGSAALAGGSPVTVLTSQGVNFSPSQG